MRPEAALPPFFVIWAALCLVVWTFYWKGSLDAKRRWHPRIVFGSAILFLGFVALMTPSALVLAVPAVAAISVLNFKMTKFCAACGATQIQNPPWITIRFCSKCGASLES